MDLLRPPYIQTASELDLSRPPNWCYWDVARALLKPPGGLIEAATIPLDLLRPPGGLIEAVAFPPRIYRGCALDLLGPPSGLIEAATKSHWTY